jgi:hypothetical protein
VDAEAPAWEVRVAARGREQPVAFVRKERIAIGPPLSFDREEPRTTALEFVLAALGADLIGCFQREASRHRLVLHDIEAAVEAVLRNPLTFLRVVGEEGDPSVRGIRVRVYVSTEAVAEQVEAAWRAAIEISPLATTLRRAVELDLTLKRMI